MKVKNVTKITRVFNDVYCAPGETADVPDLVGDKWVARFGFEKVKPETAENKATKKRTRLSEHI